MTLRDAECHKAAERLTKHDGTRNAERSAQLHDVIGHDAKLVIFIRVALRTTAAALIDIHQLRDLAHRIEPGAQIGMVKAGATMQNNDRRLLAKTVCRVQIAAHNFKI